MFVRQIKLNQNNQIRSARCNYLEINKYQKFDIKLLAYRSNVCFILTECKRLQSKFTNPHETTGTRCWSCWENSINCKNVKCIIKIHANGFRNFRTFAVMSAFSDARILLWTKMAVTLPSAVVRWPIRIMMKIWNEAVSVHERIVCIESCISVNWYLIRR